MHAHLPTPPPKLTDVRPDLPKDLDRVIARAMAKSRDDRFDSASEMLNAAHASVLRRWAPATAPVEERHEHPVAPPQPEEPVASVAAAMPAAPDAVAEPSHTVTEQPGLGRCHRSPQSLSARAAATGSSAAARRRFGERRGARAGSRRRSSPRGRPSRQPLSRISWRTTTRRRRRRRPNNGGAGARVARSARPAATVEGLRGPGSAGDRRRADGGLHTVGRPLGAEPT